MQAAPNIFAGPVLTSPLMATLWGLGGVCWPHSSPSEEETWDEATQVLGADLGQSGRELQGWGARSLSFVSLSLRGKAQVEEGRTGPLPRKNGTPGRAPYSCLRVTGWSEGPVEG